MITWALVPLIPNDDTPARRGRAVRRPRRGLGQQLHRTGRPVHVRRRLVHVQRPRQHPVPHRHHHLDHTRHTRPRPAYARCSTSPTPTTAAGHPAGPARRWPAAPAPRSGHPAGPGAVRLHHVHVGRRQPRVRQRLPDHPLLRRAVRRGQPVRRAVLVHRANPAPPPAPGARSAARPTAAPPAATPTPSAQPVPSAAAANDLHRPSARQTPLPAELDERARRRHHRHPAGQRQIDTHPTAAPAPPGAAPPATTSTPCPRSTAGPSSPSVYATRPDATLPRCRVAGSPRRRPVLSRARRRSRGT